MRVKDAVGDLAREGVKQRAVELAAQHAVRHRQHLIARPRPATPR
jgi:hypothetical protein